MPEFKYSLDYNRPTMMFSHLSTEYLSADYHNKNFEHGNLTPYVDKWSK